MSRTRPFSALTRSLHPIPASRPAPAHVQIPIHTRRTLHQARLFSLFSSSSSPPPPNPMPRPRQPKRHFTTTLVARKTDDATPSSSPSSSNPPSSSGSSAQSKLYTFSEIRSLSATPDPHRILIDVREASELRATGQIPGSQNLPISSAADGFFLPADEFEERFGWPKPGRDDEVIFYCKAGVRSRAAARLAAQAGFGGRVGEFAGSWSEWDANGGEVERVSG